MDRWREPISWLVARDTQGQTLASIALGRQHWPGLSVHSLGGYYWPFRVLPITNDPDRLNDTCEAIAAFVCSSRAFGALRLGPVPRNDPVVDNFLLAFSERGWRVLEKRIGETLAVRMPPNSEAFRRELGTHLLKKVAYFERRLQKLGTVEIRQTAPGAPAQWRAQLLDLELLEGNSWVAKQEDGTTKFVGERHRRFWEEVALDRAISDALRVWVMYFRGIPVSYSLTIDSGDTRYILANGYDDAYKDHSTGTVLAYYVLSDAAERGVSTVEWGVGDSGYKTRWHATPHFELLDRILVPHSLIGALQAAVLTNVGHYIERLGT
jgi:hypothetical protein